MAQTENKKNVLQILADNLTHNKHPSVIGSETIADQLNLRLEEVVELLHTMHQDGVVISSMEKSYSIITAKGLNYLSRSTYQYSQL